MRPICLRRNAQNRQNVEKTSAPGVGAMLLSENPRFSASAKRTALRYGKLPFPDPFPNREQFIRSTHSLLPVGIEPTSYPPQGYILSIERRERCGKCITFLLFSVTGTLFLNTYRSRRLPVYTSLCYTVQLEHRRARNRRSRSRTRHTGVGGVAQGEVGLVGA